MSKKQKWLVGVAASVLLLIICISSCIKVVDSGEIGIKFHKWSTNSATYGGVEGTCKGVVLYNPLTTDISTYETRVQYRDYPPFRVTSKDGTIFNMDSVRLGYHIDPSRACDIFVRYRKNLSEIEQGYIKTCISEAYRICGNTFSSDSLMSHRENFENAVRQRLDASMGKEGFIVDEFTQQTDPPQSLIEMINAKNRAIQSALKAENEVKEAEANAKIAIAKAKGDADAMKIKADAESYYNRTIAASLSPLIVQEDWIEKWDGKLPQVSTNSGNGLMFNLK